MARKLIVEIVGDASQLERSFGRASASTTRFERNLSKATRGVVVGTGAFRSLGRSIAFASGGFIAFAGAGEVLRKSIEAATDAATAQRQLSAQFRASGLNVRDYRQKIEEASLATSRLSGFTEIDLTQAFTLAFRGSQNVSVGLRIQSIAADVARGRHIELTKAAIALTKAYGGQATALRRLAIQVPAGLTGLRALEFVSQRFAGQAEAGTTAQQRFSAALHNTEVTLGTAILPTLNKYLERATKWLDNTKNQQRIQRDANKTASVGGKILHALGAGFGSLVPPTKKIIAFEQAMERLNKTTKDYLRNVVLPGKLPPPPITGEDVRLRASAARPGSAEDVRLRGSSVFGTSLPATPAAQRVGLRERLFRSQLALAKAQVTATDRDDRRVLSEQAKIIRSALSITSNLKKRTKLYGELAGIEQQIRTIDENAANARTAAQQQILEARKQQLEDDKAQAKQELDVLKNREQTLKQRIQAIKQQFKSEIETARSGIGDLFAGPVLQPSDDARRRTLGLGQPLSTNAAKLTQDLNAQVKQFAAFQRDLNRLAKRGAPAELIRELRAQGLASAPEAHALATTGRGTLTAFLKAFGKREALAITTARTVMRAQLVTLHATRLRLADIRERERPIVVKVELDGKQIAQIVTKEQQKTRKGTAAQRTGRNAGVNQ